MEGVKKREVKGHRPQAKASSALVRFDL